MSTNPVNRLGGMVKRGPVEFIFEAEQSLSLIEACSTNREFLLKHNFGELFGTIQGLAVNQFVLSVTKIYEKPNKRYPNLSIPSLLEFVEQNAVQLKFLEPLLVQRGLGFLGQDISEFEAADTAVKKNIVIARTLRKAIPDVESNEALRALKKLRDKKIAHSEDVNVDMIEKTTWEQAEKLLVLPRGIVSLIGDAYLATVYWDDEGNYLGSMDGSRVGRSLRRVIKAAER